MEQKAIIKGTPSEKASITIAVIGGLEIDMQGSRPVTIADTALLKEVDSKLRGKEHSRDGVKQRLRPDITIEVVFCSQAFRP